MTTYYRRKLPHWHPAEAWLFITFRLQGSLPMERTVAGADPGKAFLNWDQQLDRATTGPVWLKDEGVATAVMNAINQAETTAMCQLGAFVVMSNHVHLLVLPKIPVPKLTQYIKGTSALRANEILGRTGQRFWQHESYDHWVRDAKAYNRISSYIEHNPVRAGLIESAESWAWSSASRI